jgi:hypothetical protein
MQMQNFAFAGKKIVFDIEPVHRFQMAAQHSGRNQVGYRRCLVVAFFDLVERFQTDLQILFVLVVPLRDASIDIPT